MIKLTQKEKTDESGEKIQIRHIMNCMKADPAYGNGVAEALGISLDELPPDAAVPNPVKVR